MFSRVGRVAFPLAAAAGVSALTLAHHSDAVTCGSWCPTCGHGVKSSVTTSVTFQGTPFDVAGSMPEINSKGPDFSLVGGDLSDVTLAKHAGKQKILNIFPSIDTGVCAASVKEFNKRVTDYDNAVCLCISHDLPFAQGRWAEQEGIKNVEFLSGWRSKFAEQYGVRLASGPLSGLTARAVVVLDTDNTVLHTELVPELTDAPKYCEALNYLKKGKCCVKGRNRSTCGGHRK